jgi:hypothetical protein
MLPGLAGSRLASATQGTFKSDGNLFRVIKFGKVT